MSTQPKPTGEAEPIRVGPSWVTCEKCDEEYNTSSIHECPKPTGEWTVEVQERFLRLVDSRGNMICDTHQVFAHIFKSVADAHNAALAAERERADKNADTIEFATEKWSNANAEIQQLRAQVAAEREKMGLRDGSSLAASHATFNDLGHENKQLRKQLAAEREKVQTIVNALTDTKHALNNGGYFTPIIDAALAKVKEVK